MGDQALGGDHANNARDDFQQDSFGEIRIKSRQSFEIIERKRAEDARAVALHLFEQRFAGGQATNTVALDQTALDRGKRLLKTFGIFRQSLGNRYFLPFARNNFQPLRQSPQFPVMPPGRSSPAASDRGSDQREGGEIFGANVHQARTGHKNRRQRQTAQ
ncbi:hypothetical protein [Sphingopyxis sp.]|uniref:hypothetical protein n=1 Tax=Sphingopyxis sp. TaxID=1908224 RepID=UPI001D766A1E|nr:hypothetical protein [Sphingopyxis sp.]MBW8295710.1 hypothetical protein [Sphingopyxis sp.]